MIIICSFDVIPKIIWFVNLCIVWLQEMLLWNRHLAEEYWTNTSGAERAIQKNTQNNDNKASKNTNGKNTNIQRIKDTTIILYEDGKYGKEIVMVEYVQKQRHIFCTPGWINPAVPFFCIDHHCYVKNKHVIRQTKNVSDWVSVWLKNIHVNRVVSLLNINLTNLIIQFYF